jgi:4-methyl-5(b-hydroxyethyl)-thiazole monophosphate biosynthesis
MGILKGKKATCYPGCEEELEGAEFLEERVVIDGNITTSRGIGTAIPFALSLIEQLEGSEKAEAIRKGIVYGHN